jgi:hypothetical protein
MNVWWLIALSLIVMYVVYWFLKRDLRSKEIDFLILEAVAELGEEAPDEAIRKRVAEQLDRPISLSAVKRILEELKTRGHLELYTDTTAETWGSGVVIRKATITPAGAESLQQWQAERNQ